MKRFAAVIGVYALVFGIGFGVCWLCEHHGNNKQDKPAPDYGAQIVITCTNPKRQDSNEQGFFSPYLIDRDGVKERIAELPDAEKQEIWQFVFADRRVKIHAVRVPNPLKFPEMKQEPKPEVAPAPRAVEKKSESKTAVDAEAALVDFIRSKDAEIAKLEAKANAVREAWVKHQQTFLKVFPNNNGFNLPDANDPTWKNWQAESNRLDCERGKAGGEVQRIRNDKTQAVKELTQKVGIVRTRQLGIR